MFLEGANLSEGRGTDAPFEQLGAPWLDGERLAAALGDLLPGLHAEPVRFTPASSKYAGTAVSGVRLRPSGPFDPLIGARALLRAVREQDPDRFAWVGEGRPFIDLLAGADVLRRAVGGELSEADFEAWLAQGERLEARRVRLY